MQKSKNNDLQVAFLLGVVTVTMQYLSVFVPVWDYLLLHFCQIMFCCLFTAFNKTYFKKGVHLTKMPAVMLICVPKGDFSLVFDLLSSSYLVSFVQSGT